MTQYLPHAAAAIATWAIVNVLWFATLAPVVA